VSLKVKCKDKDWTCDKWRRALMEPGAHKQSAIRADDAANRLTPITGTQGAGRLRVASHSGLTNVAAFSSSRSRMNQRSSSAFRDREDRIFSSARHSEGTEFARPCPVEDFATG
jgi:hypothetical protein